MDIRALYAAVHEVAPDEAERVARRVREASEGPFWAVSACLLGIRCRYDGLDKELGALESWRVGRAVLPLCPEVLAGLGVPRSPMAFVGGDGAAALAGTARLVSAEGRDCTADLAAGADLALRLARAAGCAGAVLKARSPSCGVHRVHTDQGLIPGRGMFAARCVQAQLSVRSDEEIQL